MSDQDWQHDPEPTRSPFADLQRQLEEAKAELVKRDPNEIRRQIAPSYELRIRQLEQELEEARAELSAADDKALDAVAVVDKELRKAWAERDAERARADEECARADGFSALAKMLEVDLKKERARAEKLDGECGHAKRELVLQELVTQDAYLERDAAIQRVERAEAERDEAQREEGETALENKRLTAKGEGLATALERIKRVGCMQHAEAEQFWCQKDGSAHSIYCPAGIAIAALADWEKP